MWCGIVSFGQRSLKHPKLEILVPDFVPRYLEWSKWLNNIICKYSKPFLQTGDVSETFNILMTKIRFWTQRQRATGAKYPSLPSLDTDLRI